jgi:CHASE2 domain-containing sensor protein
VQLEQGAMPDTVKRKPEVAFADEIGRQAVIFDEDDVVRLLRAAVEREGSQTAFARRHGIERTRVNAILSGKRPVTDSVADALGLRRTYTAK